MIDMACILLTSGMVLYVAWRAVMLDRQLPWFTAAPAEEAKPQPMDDAPVSDRRRRRLGSRGR